MLLVHNLNSNYVIMQGLGHHNLQSIDFCLMLKLYLTCLSAITQNEILSIVTCNSGELHGTMLRTPNEYGDCFWVVQLSQR